MYADTSTDPDSDIEIRLLPHLFPKSQLFPTNNNDSGDYRVRVTEVRLSIQPPGTIQAFVALFPVRSSKGLVTNVRTVTNVGPPNSIYSVRVESLAMGMTATVTVRPSQLVFLEGSRSVASS